MNTSYIYNNHRNDEKKREQSVDRKNISLNTVHAAATKSHQKPPQKTLERGIYAAKILSRRAMPCHPSRSIPRPVS
jgi:hypothetical protein